MNIIMTMPKLREGSGHALPPPRKIITSGPCGLGILITIGYIFIDGNFKGGGGGWVGG